ncbi:hypothetical protein HII31_06440 [Pseudocercospora fuligena]|uniref:Uncharacterized protein n=1 Tax=Pseudocercospora fuligena TaxID=685502 RepID=A0A8H6RJR4_9PEZI|nr:hypothetical protein HII31_06440 [Pseudocercospora fuligena]
MDLIRQSQLAIGIREDIPNLLRCSIDHPFITFLRTGLDDIEEATAGIAAGKLQSSPVWETMVDEFIDKIGPWLFGISCLRSRFLVNAEVDTLGGRYPKNLFWTKGTHQKQIRLELRQLITSEFSKRRIEPLGQVYTSIEPTKSQAKDNEKNPSDGDGDPEEKDELDTSSISISEDEDTDMQTSFHRRGVNGKHVNVEKATEEQYGQLPNDGPSEDERHDPSAVLTAAMASPETAPKPSREQVGDVSVEVVNHTDDDLVMPHESPARARRWLTPLTRHLADTGRISEDKNEVEADHLEREPSLMNKFRYRSKKQGKRRADSARKGSAKRIKTAANDDSTIPGNGTIQKMPDEKSRSSELERPAASLRPDAESGPEKYNGSYPGDGALKDMPEITNRAHGQESGPSAPSESAPSNSLSRIVSTAPSECEGTLPRTNPVQDPDKTIERATSSSSSNSPDTTADPFKRVVAKAYLRKDCPDVVCLSECITAADLFSRLEDIQESHCKLRKRTMCAIIVRIGSLEPFRICHARHTDYGLGALISAVENKRDEEQVLFEIVWNRSS